MVRDETPLLILSPEHFEMMRVMSMEMKILLPDVVKRGTVGACRFKLHDYLSKARDFVSSCS